MKAALLALLTACTYDATDDAIWRGTISRGGAPLAYAGFDPLPQQGFQFSAGVESEGYIDDPTDGKLLVFVALHASECGKDDFLRNESTAFPIVLPIVDNPLNNDPSCMGMDLAEQPATTTDGGGRSEQTFHHDFGQHQAGTASGMFTVTNTDYSTFMDGRLQATVMDPSRGGIARTVDLQIHYIADK